MTTMPWHWHCSAGNKGSVMLIIYIGLACHSCFYVMLWILTVLVSTMPMVLCYQWDHADNHSNIMPLTYIGHRSNEVSDNWPLLLQPMPAVTPWYWFLKQYQTLMLLCQVQWWHNAYHLHRLCYQNWISTYQLKDICFSWHWHWFQSSGNDRCDIKSTTCIDHTKIR